MATTMLRIWTGMFEATAEIVAEITDGYRLAQGDADEASDIEDACYHQGAADAFADVLDLLHVTATPTEATVSARPSPGGGTKFPLQ